jgi:hypothetical protein
LRNPSGNLPVKIFQNPVTYFRRTNGYEYIKYKMTINIL